jgi:hypothetical protein
MNVVVSDKMITVQRRSCVETGGSGVLGKGYSIEARTELRNPPWKPGEPGARIETNFGDCHHDRQLKNHCYACHGPPLPCDNRDANQGPATRSLRTDFHYSGHLI